MSDKLEDNGNPVGFVIGIKEIQQLIPHRYPMLLVDKIEDVVLGQSAVGIKNVTFNENFFQGHFPGEPIMPGVLIVEAMAQTSAALVNKTLDSLEGERKYTKVLFMSIDGVKFRQPVVPGDTIKMHVEKEQSRGVVWRFKGRTFVGEKLVCEAVFTAMLA